MTASLLPQRRTRVRTSRPSGREGFKINWWLTALMLVASLTVLLPLYFTVAMALKSPDQIGTGTGLEWPSPVTWENFGAAYVATNFPRAFMSTAFVTVLSVLGALASS
jgi:raffinose/stachyose/melibiose transport system permease protein